MTIDKLIEELPSNAFFDFIKKNYEAFFTFFGKVLKIFNINVGGAEAEEGE